jgi:hypothetical protein
MRTLVTLLIAALLIAYPSKGSGANPEHQTKSYLGPSSPHNPRDLRGPKLQRFAAVEAAAIVLAGSTLAKPVRPRPSRPAN